MFSRSACTIKDVQAFYSVFTELKKHLTSLVIMVGPAFRDPFLLHKRGVVIKHVQASLVATKLMSFEHAKTECTDTDRCSVQ